MSITCVICGTENPVEGEFCEGCGTELSLSQAFSADQPINDVTQPHTSTSSSPLETQIDSFTSDIDSSDKDSQIPSESPDHLQNDNTLAAESSAQPLVPHPASNSNNTTSQSNQISSEANDPFSEFTKSSYQPTSSAESQSIDINPYPTSAPQSTPTADQKDAISQSEQVSSEPAIPPAKVSPSQASSSAVKPAKLVITKFGSVTEESIPLQATPLIVGKFDPATGPVDIDLTGIRGEEYISKQHAELYFDGKWKVRDIGSTNGVYIRPVGAKNYNPRLQMPTELNDSDEISFGNVRFVFREG